MATASVLQMLLFPIDSVDTSKPNVYETLTHGVYRSAIEHYNNFWVLAHQKIGAQKLPIFDDFATQWQL